ncbi:hypothetical protein OOJ96_18060 [Pseudomonas sp. 15FMM2]|uniref:Uncharacterized protein n=1 Tax=Pseudomonas imrae TaxID=2992837 RepID=A0ACC7PNM9_9PSED
MALLESVAQLLSGTSLMPFLSSVPDRLLAIYAVAVAIALASGLALGADPLPSQKDAAGYCRNEKSRVLSGLDRIYVRDEFRIIYATHGQHALPSGDDLNENGIPDQVEDIATQMVTARRIYSQAIGLKHPLSMPRYARVKSVDVFLLDMKKGNGLAYDEAINYRLGFDGNDGRCTLRIDLKNSLPRQNVSPAHELFHLYQYGYSMFKARWFLEGTARWVEYALKPGAGPQTPLPTTGKAVQAQVFSQTYRASGLWNRLAAITDPPGRLRLPKDLAGTTYVDGSAVIHDDLLHGSAFIRATFEELENLSISVSSRNGWSRYNWKEADQKSPAHNEEIFHAVMRALQQSSSPGSFKDQRVKSLIDMDTRLFAPQN